jgi:pyruvate,water dikinase
MQALLATAALPLEDSRAEDLSRAGGKGMNLARLTRAGFAVPRGFVIPAEAIAAQQARLRERVEALLETGGGIDEASGKIQDAVLAEPVHEELAAAIRGAYRELMRRCGDGTLVAVRSSAIAEDLAGASFAGQHDTVLGVRGEEEAVRSVMRCLASLWSPRAIQYRARAGHTEAVPAFAVILQEQVEADVSGVMFTVNPVEPGSGELLITASFGLGEAIVSGAVTPDTFVITKTGEVRSRTLGAKERMTAARGGEKAVPAERRSQFALSDTDLRRLAEAGLAIEKFYGAPQDIEWSLAGDRLWILQSRPVTGLQDVPAEDPADAALSFAQRVFLERSPLLANFADHFPEPVTALDFTTLVKAGLIGIGAFMQQFGLRMRTVEEILPATADGAMRFRPGPPKPRPGLLALPYCLYRVWKLNALREWLDVDLPFIRTEERSFPEMDLPAAGAAELVRAAGRMQAVLEEVSRRRFRKYFATGLLHTQAVRVLARIAVGRADAGETVRKLHMAIPHSTALMNRDLHQLVDFAAARPELARLLQSDAPPEVWKKLLQQPAAKALLESFLAFLGRHGARSASGMLPVPSQCTWAEKPEVVVGLVQALLRCPRGSSSLSDDEQEQRRAVESVMSGLDRGARRWLRLGRVFERSLEQSRQFVLIREASLHEGETRISGAREIAREIGRRLAMTGVLENPGEVFHLRLEELLPALTGDLPAKTVKQRVSVRIRQHRRWLAAARQGENWARLAAGLGPTSRKSSVGSDKVLRGLAASAGRVSGVARVVRGQDEFHKFQPGEILVCPATAPAWTPLFAVAKAVVTDIGGPLSHAAIVAREYGIPAVLGTGRATQLIADGQSISVDGAAGVVEIGF